jgi:uncharacterized protein (TIGR00299 family) protein
MKIAYFDCFAGAAGDMIAAAMLDAGLDKAFLVGQLDSLGLSGLDIKISRTKRCGITAVYFEPVSSDPKERRLADITKLINNSKIAATVKQRAIEIFEDLARVEGRIHGKSTEEIHFHEIGAVDSIVDVVSACIGLETLGIEKVYCSEVALGRGVIKSAHGLLPVPAPATAGLLKDANVPIIAGPIEAELLTPTGAAILANFVTEFGPLPPMRIDSVGYGAGTLQSDEFPNVLRLIIGTGADENAQVDCVCLLETNVDDATSERVGFVLEKLLEGGALDVFTTAIGMKHNRPGVKLSVICAPCDMSRMEGIIFEQGLTLGIRKQILQRSKLLRQFVTVKTQFGEIRVKTAAFGGKIVSAKPEYADCAATAKKYNVPLKIIQRAVMKRFENTITKKF